MSVPRSGSCTSDSDPDGQIGKDLGEYETKERTRLGETRPDYWISSNGVLTFWVEGALAAGTYGAVTRPKGGAGAIAALTVRKLQKNGARCPVLSVLLGGYLAADKNVACTWGHKMSINGHGK